MSSRYYPVLFICFILSYFFLYAFYGYNDADDGYILALSWRVFNGEIPYKDFIYIRPPFTPFFHSLPLYIIPENYQILFERFLSFLFMGLSSLFCSLSIERVFKNEIQINSYLLSTIGFVFSTHNFSPMPWYTVDGVFFASIGIYLLIRYSTLISIFGAMLFLFLSALCKQPFYLMPFTGVVYILLAHKNGKNTLFSIFSLGLFICLFFFMLFKLDALKSFIELTTGSTKIADLLAAGVFSYFKVYSLYIILPIAFWIFSVRLSRYERFKRINELVPYFFISFILLYPLSRFVYSSLYKAMPYDPTVADFYMDSLASFLFMAAAIFLILNFKFENRWISITFLILLSWCSGISWGSQTPVFFSTPLFFCFFLISYQYFNVKNITSIAVYYLLIGTVAYYWAYQKPACGPLKKELTYEVSDIFPKLQHIKVSKDIYEKYHELKLLINNYGKNFKTLPGMPLTNYLTNTKSPISLDWVCNAECSYRNEKLLNLLYKNKSVVFVEKEPQLITVTNSKEKFNSLLTYLIKTTWFKVDSTKHFDIYKIIF